MPVKSELAGHSSKLIKLAKERQRSGPFKKLVEKYEGKGCRKTFPSTSKEWPKANPGAYYRPDGEKTIFKGSQLPEGILPVNVKEVNPSLPQKIKIECHYFFRKFLTKLCR